MEANDDPRKIDHVWTEVRAGEDGILQIALNTRSCQSAEAGYDPRISVGVAVTTWEEFPEAGALGGGTSRLRRDSGGIPDQLRSV